MDSPESKNNLSGNGFSTWRPSLNCPECHRPFSIPHGRKYFASLSPTLFSFLHNSLLFSSQASGNPNQMTTKTSFISHICSIVVIQSAPNAFSMGNNKESLFAAFAKRNLSWKELAMSILTRFAT